MATLVSEALGEEVGVDTDITKLRAICDKLAVPYEEIFGQGWIINKLFDELAEDKLWQPTFVTEHPVEVSPLAREHRTKPGYTERFEAYVANSELCNAFTELNNPRVQNERFLEQQKTKDVDDEAMQMDHDYIRALEYGLPPTAGMGIGIDRMAMLLADTSSIRDVILFPTLRPEK